MPQPRRRACLESGLSLDLNKLMRQARMRAGAISGHIPTGGAAKANRANITSIALIRSTSAHLEPAAGSASSGKEALA